MAISFEGFSIWMNALIYLISAGAIWSAGFYLEKLGGVISKRTSMGEAFIGTLLISLADTLPEIATTVTAIVFLDNPTLAIHALLGGVALQIVLLSVADWMTRDTGAFTFFTPDFVLLIQGVGLLILLQVLIAGVTASGVPLIGSVSLWPILLFLIYILVMYLTYEEEGHPRWTPIKERMPSEEFSEQLKEKKNSTTKREERLEEQSIKKVGFYFAAASVIVLVAGWGAAKTSDAMAAATGLSPSFMGATFLALASSLPELSTTTNAVRDKRYSMAISNIFGGCALNVGLLLLLEVLLTGETIMIYAKNSVVFIASASAVMVGIYLWGLMERESRTLFSMGWDSIISVVVYVGTMTVLYFIS